MLLKMLVKVGTKALWANKLRSFLAMLGIIIGVGAVISMLALGAGIRIKIMSRVSALGTDLLVVRPGQAGTRGVMSGTAQTLTLDDAAALARVEGVRMVAPVVSGSAQIKYYDKNVRVTASGVSPSYMEIRNFEIEFGRNFSDREADHFGRVVILGPVTAENLFGKSEAVGETVKVNGVNYQVCGVLKSKGDQGWFNPDDQAIIPYSTAMKQLFGIDRLREIDVLIDPEVGNAAVMADLVDLLRQRHRLLPSAPDDFNVRDQAEVVSMTSSFSNLFTVLLGGIAGISLLVGGIGIMNIMLVTVTERTREIGLRKAIGARERDILGQFLFESVLVSGMGGLIGTVFGICLSRLIPYIAEAAQMDDFVPVVEPFSVMLSLGVAVAVGVFFGFYPARRAASLDPIEALRYE